MTDFDQVEIARPTYGTLPEKVLMALSFVMIVLGGLMVCLPTP